MSIYFQSDKYFFLDYRPISSTALLLVSLFLFQNHINKSKLIDNAYSANNYKMIDSSYSVNNNKYFFYFFQNNLILRGWRCSVFYKVSIFLYFGKQEISIIILKAITMIMIMIIGIWIKAIEITAWELL